MLSDVDSLIQAAQSKASQSSRTAMVSSLASAAIPTTHSSSESTATKQPNNRSTRPFVPLLAAGVGIVSILVFLYSIYQSSPQPRGADNASSSLSSAAGKPTSPPDFSQQVTEDIPPIGTDRILTYAQIQYCLAEAIRLEASSLLVHDTDDAGDVVRYNSTVDDYNRRCSRYRYHRDTFESAKRAVELHRTRLKRKEGSVSIAPSRRFRLQSIRRKLHQKRQTWISINIRPQQRRQVPLPTSFLTTKVDRPGLLMNLLSLQKRLSTFLRRERYFQRKSSKIRIHRPQHR